MDIRNFFGKNGPSSMSVKKPIDRCHNGHVDANICKEETLQKDEGHQIDHNVISPSVSQESLKVNSNESILNPKKAADDSNSSCSNDNAILSMSDIPKDLQDIIN